MARPLLLVCGALAIMPDESLALHTRSCRPCLFYAAAYHTATARPAGAILVARRPAGDAQLLLCLSSRRVVHSTPMSMLCALGHVAHSNKLSLQSFTHSIASASLTACGSLHQAAVCERRVHTCPEGRKQVVRMGQLTEVGCGCCAGDVADEQEVDMIVLSTAAVHAKYVNANLLAEFCPCATLLIP